MTQQCVHTGYCLSNMLKGVVPGRPEKAAMLVRNDAVLRGVQAGGWLQRLKAEEGTARD